MHGINHGKDAFEGQIGLLPLQPLQWLWARGHRFKLDHTLLLGSDMGSAIGMEIQRMTWKGPCAWETRRRQGVKSSFLYVSSYVSLTFDTHAIEKLEIQVSA